MNRAIRVAAVIAVVGAGILGCKKGTASAGAGGSPGGAAVAAIPTLPSGLYAPGLKMTVNLIAAFPSHPGGSVVSPDGTRVEGGGLFSPDSRHHATGISGADQHTTVQLDGTAGPSYAMLRTMAFSPDSRLAYGAIRSDRKGVWVLNGVEQVCTPPDYVPMQIAFSADGKHFAYIEEGPIGTMGTYKVCVDGKPWSRSFGQVVPGSLCLSADGRRMAVISDNTVFENDVPQTKYDEISEGTIVFSPDAKRMLYSGSRQGKHYLVDNGKEVHAYGFVHASTITFSPDSKRLAYAAYAGDQATTVFDPRIGRSQTITGQPVVNIDGVETSGNGQCFVFSSDSAHLAYIRSEGYITRSAAPESPQYYGANVMLDGKRLGGAKASVQNLQFSPDNKHVAYMTCGTAEENPTIVVDGIDLPYPQEGIVTRVWFTAPDALNAIIQFAEMGKEIRRVELKLTGP